MTGWPFSCGTIVDCYRLATREEANMKVDEKAVSAAIEPYRAEGAEAVELFKVIQVNNQEDLEFANEMTKQTKIRFAELKDKEKSWTGPAQDYIRTVQAMFRPALKLLTDAEADLKAKMAAYHLKATQERTEAMVSGAIVEAPPEATGTTFKTVRQWRIKDADRVPHQFCSPDEKKIQSFLDNGGREAIPGVEFYDDVQVTVRKGK